MAVEDITSSNEKELKDSVATSTIPPSKTDLVEEHHIYADRNGNENAVRDESEIRVSVSQCNISCGKIENTNLYNDNNVMQCELPELMGYSEKDCNVVEEICMDDGAPFKDKIVVQSESGNGNGLCTVLPFEENQNDYVTKEREDGELLSSLGSKSSSENSYSEDGIQEWGTKEEIDMEMLLSDALKLLLENHLVDDIGNDEVMKSANADSYEVQPQSGQISCSEAESETPSLVSTAEGGAKKSSPVNDLSYNSKVDSATITFDFNSSKSTASNRDEHSDDVAPLKIYNNLARHEVGVSGVSAVGSEIQGRGESSLSKAGLVSGLISYSGPMTQSGSVSLRSDSSTTSTRSFAFPTIQSEWISSPIRMAKADRRHYKKHRCCWMEGVLCCRF